MHFLPDVWVTCDVCKGSRFNRETLQIRYKGKNNCRSAGHGREMRRWTHFATCPASNASSRPWPMSPRLRQAGSECHDPLWWRSATVKLAKELSRAATGDTVYILDEPTTGLHFADIQKLLDVLHRADRRGNTVIVIEHTWTWSRPPIGIMTSGRRR